MVSGFYPPEVIGKCEFCDGTHNKTARTEDAGKLYWYDAQGNRQECADQYPGISTA